MRNIFSGISRKDNWLMPVLLFIYVMTMAPFVLSDFVDPVLRYVVYFFLSISLLWSVRYFKIQDIAAFFVLACFLFIEIIHLSDGESVKNLLTLLSVWFFGILLLRYSDDSTFNSDNLFRWYKKISKFLALSSLLSIVLYFTTGGGWGLPVLPGKYDYISTIFGYILLKNFVFIQVPRVCNYFAEPILASTLFAINTVGLQYDDNRFELRSLRILSLLAGILLFSVSYYILCMYLILAKRLSNLSLIILLLFFPLLYQLAQIPGFELISDATSFSDRDYRIKMFFDGIADWNTVNIMLGKGAVSHFVGNVLNKDFNIGLMRVFWQYGFFGLINFGVISIFISRGNVMVLGLIILTSLFFDVTMYPFYYFVFVVYSLRTKRLSNPVVSINNSLGVE